MASLGNLTRLTVPKPWMLFPLEMPRLYTETAALIASSPVLVATGHGDGHPVLVVSGLSGANGATMPLRTYLRVIGNTVHTPKMGTMQGTPRQVIKRLDERVDDLYKRTGQKVSLVAWSVGGAFARQVALERPTHVRQLITLGSPLDGPYYPEGLEKAKGPLPVPVTSVYSRTDGVFDWRQCVIEPGDRAENVEIISSHFGMANNAATYQVVANRLAQPEGHWEPYHSPWHMHRHPA